jgi:hypothetical protein
VLDELLDGVFDGADLLETARDSGIWKARYPYDGTHRSATGNTAAAVATAPSMFSL